MKIFSVKDKVRGKFISCTIADSEQMFVRVGLSSILMDYPINDVEFYCIGDFDEDLGIIKPCVPRLCDWNCYKFPETRRSTDKFLTIDKIAEMAQKKKLEFLQKSKDNIKDLENLDKYLDEQIEQCDESDKEKSDYLKKYKKQLSIEIDRLKIISEKEGK